MTFGITHTENLEADGTTGILLDEADSCTRVPIPACKGCAQYSRNHGCLGYTPADPAATALQTLQVIHEDAEYVRKIKALITLKNMLVEGIPEASTWPSTESGNVSREVGGWVYNSSLSFSYDGDGDDPEQIPEFRIADARGRGGTPCFMHLENSALSHRGGWLAYPLSINTALKTITFTLATAASTSRADERIDPEQPVRAWIRLWAVGYAPQWPDIGDVDQSDGSGDPVYATWPNDGAGAVADPLAALQQLIYSSPWKLEKDHPAGDQYFRRAGCPSLASLVGAIFNADGVNYADADDKGFWSGFWGKVRTWIDGSGINHAELDGGLEYYLSDGSIGPGGVRRKSLYGDDTTDTNDPEDHYVSPIASSRLGRHCYTGAITGPHIESAEFRETTLVCPKIAAGEALQVFPGITFQRKYYKADFTECTASDPAAVYGGVIRLIQTVKGFKDYIPDNDTVLFERTVGHYAAITGGYKFYLRHELATIARPGGTGNEDVTTRIKLGGTSSLPKLSRRPYNWACELSLLGAAASQGIVRGRCIRLVHPALPPFFSLLRWPVMVARACDAAGPDDPDWVGNELDGVPGFDHFAPTAAKMDSIEAMDEGGTLVAAMAIVAASGTKPTIQVLPLAFAKGVWSIWNGGPELGSDTAVQGALSLPASGVFLLPEGLSGTCLVLRGPACFRSDLPAPGDFIEQIISDIWSS